MAIKTDAELLASVTLITTDFLWVAFYSNFPVPSGQDLRSQKNEIGRLALSKTIVANLITADYTMGLTDCICPFSSVASDGSNSTTSFKVADHTQFKVNDRIQVGNEKDVMVTAIDTGTHFITINNPLSAIPATSTAVNVKISQRAILRGGTITHDTGELAIIEQFILYKTSLLGPIAGRMQGNIL